MTAPPPPEAYTGQPEDGRGAAAMLETDLATARRPSTVRVFTWNIFT
jgi:hypothetical protein